MARELRTILSIDMAGFRRGLRMAGRDVKTFHREIAAPIGRGIARLGRMVMAVGALGAGFAALGIKAVTDAGDALDKMSKRTGIAADELARLIHAARLSDVDVGSLERGITALQRALYEGIHGSKEYGKAFEALGLDMASLAKMTPAAQLSTVLDTLAGVTDQSKRAALAMRLFERGGKELLPLLAAGKDGLRAMKKEADRLGIVFDERDVALSALFRDNLTRLRAALIGLARSVGGLDTINRALQALIERVVRLRQSEGFATFVGSVKSAATTIGTYTVGIARAIYEMADGSGKNLVKWAASFAGVALAFKLNLVLPLIKLSAMLVSGLFTALVGPVGGIIAALGALFTGFSIGDAIERTFDVSTVGAKIVTVLMATGEKIAAFFKSIGPGFKEEFSSAVEEINAKMQQDLESLGSPRGNGKKFAENLKDSVKESIDWMGEQIAQTGEMLIPESVKKLVGRIEKLRGGFALPELTLDVPGLATGVEGGAERGVRSGMSDKKWGKVFTGAEFSEARMSKIRAREFREKLRDSTRVPPSIRAMMARTKAAGAVPFSAEQTIDEIADVVGEQKRTNQLLANLDRRGAMVF